jgi:hypothetical protein
MSARLRAFYPTLAALALAVLVAPAAAAAPVQDPIPVGPDAYFTATVNVPSSSTAAEPVIQVVCPGPATVGESGHPLAGQSVEVQAIAVPTAVTPQIGFTGSAADQIDAIITGPSSAAVNPAIVLTSFFAPVAIPTSLNLPCSGSGVVSFVPIPASPGARSVAVDVLFENIAV